MNDIDGEKFISKIEQHHESTGSDLPENSLPVILLNDNRNHTTKQ